VSPPTKKDWAKYLEAYDFQGVDNESKENIIKGFVNFAEFCWLLGKKSLSRVTRSQLVAAFEVLDKDGTGEVGTEELRKTLLQVRPSVPCRRCGVCGGPPLFLGPTKERRFVLVFYSVRFADRMSLRTDQRWHVCLAVVVVVDAGVVAAAAAALSVTAAAGGGDVAK